MLNNKKFILEAETIINLDELNSMKKKMKIKFGVDPTSNKLHIGNAIPLLKLREFQKLGHEIYLVFGTFTGQIGDPTDKLNIRQPLSEDIVEKNILNYKSQIKKIIDVDKIKIVKNKDWLKNMSIAEYLNYLKFFSVSKILNREDFNKRISLNKSLSMLEINYPILQAIDSVVLEADVEIGGQDQLLNMLCGRTLMKNMNLKPQTVITFPLIEGTDGKRKMSKSFNNTIDLDDENMYGKVMSTPDETAFKYFQAIGKTKDEFRNISKYELKKKLAYMMVSFYFDEKRANFEEKKFFNIVSNTIKKNEIQKIKNQKNLLKTVVHVTKKSNTKCKRLISDGSVKINGEKIFDHNYETKTNEVLKIGKYITLIIE